MDNAKNKLEAYVTNNGGTAMPLTGANGNAKGVTSADELDLGLYMVVKTKVPEQVTDTVKPFFVSLPMTENDGDEWNYDVVVYPKGRFTLSPALEKLVAEN
ncbi:MAG: pilin N-terminal domain-containing protein [Lachnospiraceae bacterium]